MTNEEIKDQLRQLLSAKELSEGFKSQQDCIDWSNKVAPLLKFNEEHYQTFREAAHRINVIGLSMKFQDSNLNIMKSTATQALIELESNIASVPNEEPAVTHVEKITLSYLWHNAPVSFWVQVVSIFLAVIVGAFSLGVILGKSKLYHDIMTPQADSNSTKNIPIQNAIPIEKTIDKTQAPINSDAKR